MNISTLAKIIFWSRWLQAPLYLGLILVQAAYVYHFIHELWTLISDMKTLSEAALMLQVLSLVDVVMVANLLVMVIIGGYETFVSRLNIDNHPDDPEWLDHVNAGTMKIKFAMALIGISSIHLLKSFINAASLDTKTLLWQVVIHSTFLVSALALAWTDKLLHSDKKH
jgi:uncharacterized protein (TIGR00645 family)